MGILWPAGLKVAFILAAAFAVYWPALRGGWVWDDDAHVTKPALRSLQGLWRIWTDVGATQQYYPVLHSAFWLEHRLWGDAAVGYHVLNVLLHATAACLVVAVLRRFWKPAEAPAPIRFDGPFVAGLLFALHPVCVESVAWVSEQKNTLSTVFYLLATLAYLRWRRRSGEPSLASYLLATLFFLLALLSKSVTATLPAALLVVFWWGQGRLSWRRDVVPLLPWFTLGISSGLFTAWVERRYIGAQGADFALSFVQRVLLAGRVFWFYLGKLFWPKDLVFFYPRWTIDPKAGWQYLFPLCAWILVGAAAAIYLSNRERRGFLAGIFFFGGSLFPALGFFNVYPFLFSYVADHFQYLASLGVFALAAGALERLLGRAGTGLRISLAVGTAAILAALGAESRALSAEYRNAETLYRSTLAKNPGAWLAHLNLGSLLLDRGEAGEAERHYRIAEQQEPGFPTTHFDMGMLLLKVRRPEEAVPEFEEAVRLAPGDAEARDDLGISLAESGRVAQAEARFREAIALQPENATAHYDLGVALQGQGRTDEAVREYAEAVRLRPELTAARSALEQPQGQQAGRAAP